jgi:hypothetical protein
VAQATEKPITEFYWIFQEKEAPFELAVFRMDDECRERALKIVKRLYEKVGTAKKSGLYPSKYTSQVYDIDLPHYLLKLRETL